MRQSRWRQPSGRWSGGQPGWAGGALRARGPRWPALASVAALLAFLWGAGLALGQAAPPAEPRESAAGPGALVADAYAPPPPAPALVPAPKELQWLPAAFPLGPDAVIVVGDELPSEDLYAARELNEELRLRLGFQLPVVPAAQAPLGADGLPRRAIVLGESGRNAWVLPLVQHWGVAASGLPAEGYALVVRPEGVLVAGSDRRGTFYGVQTLKELLAAGQPPVLRGAVVRDWPDFPFRAVLIHPDKDSPWFHGRLIDRVWSRYKFNHLLIEVDYVRWESHPELARPWSASKEEIRQLIEVARQHLMDVSPLLATLSHVEWIFADGRNLDLAEDPETPYAYNPLNPRTYELVFSVLDEAIDLFRPAFVHIGHDELRNRGRFPNSREGLALGFGELFTRDVLTLYEHLRQRGVGTMMWGDVLLDPEMRPYLDRLPKDIVVADWRYEPALTYPSLDLLQEAGFPVVGATWRNTSNIETFSAYAFARKARGMIQTTWAGYYGSRTQLRRAFDQLAAYTVAGDRFWNAAGSRPASAAYDPGERFLAAWDPPSLRPRGGYLVDLRPAANRRSVDDPAGERGWLATGALFDLRRLAPGPQRVGGILFWLLDPDQGPNVIMLRGTRPAVAQLPDAAVIPVGRRAAELAFLHATGFEVRPGTAVGGYVIHYADGSAAGLPLVYGENIWSWLKPAGPALLGEGAFGLRYGIGLTRWRNPFPEKEIAWIGFHSAGTEATPVLFALTLLDG